MIDSYFTAQVSRREFCRPDKMDPKLIQSLVELRERLAIPLRFTKMDGQIWHPEGDASPPSSTVHATRSLHKYGLPGQSLGLAQDFDAFNKDTMTGWAILEAIIGTGLLRGMGYYLDWRTLGYHVDLRPVDHFTLANGEDRKVWIRAAGQYHMLPTFADRKAFMNDFMSRHEGSPFRRQEREQPYPRMADMEELSEQDGEKG